MSKQQSLQSKVKKIKRGKLGSISKIILKNKNNKSWLLIITPLTFQKKNEILIKSCILTVIKRATMLVFA